MTARGRALALALLATLALSVGVSLSDAPDEAQSLLPSMGTPRDAVLRREPPPTIAAARSAPVADAAVVPDEPAWKAAPPEALAAWGEPPPPPVAEPTAPSIPLPSRPAARAAAASAPRLDYQWIGRLEDASGMRALLSGPLTTVVVREDDRIDEHWRVERLSADELQLRWLPNGQRLTLRLAPG